MSVREDRDLQRFLDGDDPVAQAYRDLPSDEPPAELDALILEAARVEAKRPVRPRWFVPLSVAATVVLGVGFSIKQLSSPFDAASDVDYVPVAQNSAEAIAPAGATRGAPVPKPSLDELLKSDTASQGSIKKIELDTDAIRKEALSAQGFEIRLTPGNIGESVERESAPAPAEPERGQEPVSINLSRSRSGDLESAAPVATGNRADVDAARQPAPAAQDSEMAALRQRAELHGAVEARARRADDPVSAQDLNDQYALPPAPKTAAAAPRPVTDAIDQIVVTGSRVTADNVALSSREQARVDQILQRIRRQWRLGRTDEAQALFDEFIEDYPDYELPDDFPLQRPEPEDTP